MTTTNLLSTIHKQKVHKGVTAPDDVLLYRWGTDYVAEKGITVSAAELKEMASKVKYIPQLMSLIDGKEKDRKMY